ncbi:hypothetical protein [Streptosporangium canum]|uniref:hypothetical protein n=1 Tax=Streptosporangium canum TaxID=324952 RepID=UPI00378A8CB7
MLTPLTCRLSTVLTAGALTLVLAACGGPTTNLDAAGVVKALIGQGLPITLTVTYTADTDPSKLLGRPNGYVSKASFTDQRVDPSKVTAAEEGDVDLGGIVEVFKDAGQAEQRAAYNQEVSKTLPMLLEYDYVAGPVLVRVSRKLPSQHAKTFETALGKIVK